MNKYIAKHSLLTNMGAIIYFGGLISSLIYLLIVKNDTNIELCIFIFAVIGGILMWVGLINEA